MQYREGQKIAILGFGITGQATAKFLTTRGADVSVFEGKSMDEFESDVVGRVESKGGELYFEQDFSQGIAGTDFFPNIYDFVVVSPGISPYSPLFQDLMSHNIKVCNDLILFIQEWREIGPIVGVTGSNGKSTVVSVLFESLKKVKNCILGGNIGNSPLDMLDVEYEKDTVAVLEISSSQLELFGKDEYLDICVLLNLSSNHLDRYDGDMGLYAQTKLNGVDKKKTELIISGDDAGIQKFVFPILKKRKIKNPTIVSLEENSNAIFPDTFNFEKCNLVGVHNLYNVAFVISIMNTLRIPFEEYRKTLESFDSLDHRIKKVKEVNGVTYINDSKSTSPHAIEVALDTLGKKKNITLIAGGDDKDMNFSNLEDLFEMYVKNLILLPGDIDEKLKKISGDINIYDVNDMDEAVKLAHSIDNLESSDIVLLSPGAGSHSTFHGFADRGEKFKNCVLGL